MDAEEKQARVTALFQTVQTIQAKYYLCNRSLPSGFNATKIERAYAKKNHCSYLPHFCCEQRSKIFGGYSYIAVAITSPWYPQMLCIRFCRTDRDGLSQMKGDLTWFIAHVGIDGDQILEFFEQALHEINGEIGLRLQIQRKALGEPAITLSIELSMALLKKEELEKNLATLRSAIQTAVSKLEGTKNTFKSKTVQQIREELGTALRNLEKG